MMREHFQSINRVSSLTNQKGISLIEVILSVALLGVFASVFIFGLITAQENIRITGMRTRALFLAQEGLEAARSLRDTNYANLSNGTYGLVQSGGHWVFSGSQDITEGFTRDITISSVDTDTKNITSHITWQQNLQRNGTLTLTTRLTNWHAPSSTQSTYFSFNISSVTLSGDNKEVRNIELTNTSSQAITMDTITAIWVQSAPKIERVRIEENTVWSKIGPGTPTGTQNSGTELNSVHTSIGAHESKDMDVKFTQAMIGDTLTLTIKFIDGSIKTTSISF